MFTRRLAAGRYTQARTRGGEPGKRELCVRTRGLRSSRVRRAGPAGVPLVAAVIVGLMSGVCTPVRAGAPAMLATLETGELEHAIASARGSGRIVIAAFGAKWCGPCRAMERDVWPQPDVQRALAGRFELVHVDFDTEKAKASSLQVQSLPAVLAIRDGQVIDRWVGGRGPEAVVAWLNGLPGAGASAGMNAGSPVAANTTSTPTPVPVTPMHQVRVVAAPEVTTPTSPRPAAIRASDGELTAARAAWLGLDRSTPGASAARELVRVSDLRDLCAGAPELKSELTRRRESLKASIGTGEALSPELEEWVQLGTVLGQRVATLAWFDRAKKNPRARATLAALAPALEEPLCSASRFAEFGRIIPDGRAYVQRVRRELTSSGITKPQRLRAMRSAVASAHAGLLAAGLDSEAEQTRTAALAADDSAWMRLALVSRALDAGQARAWMSAMLDEAEQRGAGAGAHRARLARALGEK